MYVIGFLPLWFHERGLLYTHPNFHFGLCFLKRKQIVFCINAQTYTQILPLLY